MPVPPEGQFDVVLSTEAEAQWKAGEGGPWAVTPAQFNGVYSEPIGAWRFGTWLGVPGLVRAHYC